MMRTNRDRQIPHIPRGIRLISNLYIFGGILMLLTSIWLVWLEYISLIVENNGGGPGIMAVLIFPILVGAHSIGALHGLVTIAAGVGLKKMKRWGLKCSYISTRLWILFGLLVILIYLPSLFSLPGCVLSSIGALIIGISMKNWSYLDRVSHYFEANPVPSQN
jgi:uncharacterized membrane protein